VNPDDVEVYFGSLGPWWDTAAVAAYLDISDEVLRDMIGGDKVLAVVFSEGRPYFPAWQFDGGGVVSGLAEVVAVLRPAFVAPETIVAWFRSEVFCGDLETQIDALRSGRPQEVLRDAHRDAVRLLRP
jgi:hypothetical protein